MMVRSLATILVATWIATAAPSQQSTTPSNSTPNIEERLKLVLSKIAPLEKWEFSWSDSQPRICSKFFRATPGVSTKFFRAIERFQGRAKWGYVDNCLQEIEGMTFVAIMPLTSTGSQPSRMPPRPSSKLTREEATHDLEKLADYIEEQLDLTNVQPRLFSEAMLTREGLAASHREFEDFEDGGERTVYLIVRPGNVPTYDPQDTDVLLHFTPFDDEMSAIFPEILGIDSALLVNRALTDEETEKIEKDFPVLWEVSDYYEDAYLSPGEAEQLYRECEVLDKKATSAAALRGLDKLMRIAHWASAKHYGILFSAP